MRNGFTLVELLVVITLLALTAGAVTLTIGSQDRRASETATRLASRLAAARDEAIMAGAPIRAWFSASGYGFERFDDNSWTPIAVKPFGVVDWPEGVIVKLAGDERGRARVHFDTLGMTDGALAVRLTKDGGSATVEVTASGDVAVK